MRYSVSKFVRDQLVRSVLYSVLTAQIERARTRIYHPLNGYHTPVHSVRGTWYYGAKCTYKYFMIPVHDI